MMQVAGISIEDLVKETIPIYTLRQPHPTRKRKADCAIEAQYKQGLRQLMLIELRLGGDRQTVIDKYKMKVEQL